MLVEVSLWVTSVLFLIGGFLIASAKGVRGRAYIFIFTLTVIYIMLGVFTSDLVWKYAEPNYKDLEFSKKEQAREQSKGTAIFIVGLIGIILLSQFRGIKTMELGYVFGIGGLVQVVSGLIGMISGEAIELKFLVTLVALILLSYLFYKHRDFLLGK